MDCIIELGYGNSKIIVKNDQEPAIKSVIDMVVQRRVNVETLLEESPKGSSQSNGASEIAVQQAQGRIRSMRLALEQNYNTKIPIDHPIIAWMCVHAGFCHNRFQMGHDGRTPYRRVKGKDFDKPLVEFGENVHYKKTKLQTCKIAQI